ncbi:MAG: ATP-binding protein, partial [Desulfonatronovibrionaceae bacterium]
KRGILFSLLLVAGFTTSIFYLSTRKKWQRLRQFFLLQLVTDLVLTAFLVFLTGGIRSNFVFLFLGIVFLYGRTLGFKSAFYSGLGILVFLMAAAWIQFEFPGLWAGRGLSGGETVYILFLQTLGTILTVLLVRMGKGREEHLVLRLLQHEVALEEAERLKRQVFDWMDSGLVVTDSGKRISAVNSMALQSDPGLSRENVIKRPLAEVFPELAAFWDKEKKDSFLREMRCKDGRIFSVRVSRLPAQEGHLVIFSDITEMRKLQRQVFEMEKLATTGELAAGLAHEMKNPLAGIKAALQIIGQNNVDSKAAGRLHNVVERDIERLDNLLRDFLVFARPKGSQKETVRLAEVLDRSRNIVQGQFPQVDIKVDPWVREVFWAWDPDQLQQVVLNLLLNAAQAASTTAEHPEIGIKLSAKQGGEALVIRDNGPGVPPDIEARIFDPFFTTKPQGSGLGLSIAQRLAARNDSRVVVETGEAKGAKSYIIYKPEPAAEG